MNKKHIHLVRTILSHAGFWILYPGALAAFFSTLSRFPADILFISYLIEVPAYAFYTYIMVYLLIPRLILSRASSLYIPVILILTAVAALMKQALNYFVFHRLFLPEIFAPDRWISWQLFMLSLFWVLIPFVLFGLKKYFLDWLKTLEEKNELQKKNLESELQLLKAQLNPHFLFNTLNNLYALTLIKSDKAPEVVSKLSELFRYVIYECNAAEVSLDKEVNMISNYIELEKLRYDERLRVEFAVTGLPESFQIAPMLLLTFIENCFKHGSANDPLTPWIRISLTLLDNRLEFVAINSKPAYQTRQVSQAKGVGLANARKRLGLIYRDMYTLEIADKPESFRVQLLIDYNHKRQA